MEQGVTSLDSTPNSILAHIVEQGAKSLALFISHSSAFTDAEYVCVLQNGRRPFSFLALLKLVCRNMYLHTMNDTTSSFRALLLPGDYLNETGQTAIMSNGVAWLLKYM